MPDSSERPRGEGEPAVARRSDPRGLRNVSGPQLLKAYIFLVSSLTVLGVFLFTYNMVQSLSRQVATTSQVLARFCAQASFPAAQNPELHRILRDLTAGIDFPMVITDTEGTPRAWRSVGIPESLVAAASIDSLKSGLPIAPVIRARIETVAERARRLDHRNLPIPMHQAGSGFRLGAVHYGEPPVLERLRWMPYIAGGGLVLLMSIGLWGLTSIRQAEKRSIWVGMARETAHQLGTPISALLGWVELLRAQSQAPASHASGQEMEETLDEMERDIERLSRIAQRFSHVGSAPQLQPKDVTPVVKDAVEYLRRRLPGAPEDVEIREQYAVVPPVRLNSELLTWALENLVNNAVTALDKKPGLIEISLAPRGAGEVEMTVTDNGRGMSAREQRRAFEPGFTTKRRGWGLGLALARRVVQEYHGGRLFVGSSAPGQGTRMVIRLPAAK